MAIRRIRRRHRHQFSTFGLNGLRENGGSWRSGEEGENEGKKTTISIVLGRRGVRKGLLSQQQQLLVPRTRVIVQTALATVFAWKMSLCLNVWGWRQSVYGEAAHSFASLCRAIVCLCQRLFLSSLLGNVW